MAKPRSIITPDHFTVAPELLGLPLATPSRRAAAMAIDLLLIVLLVKTGGVFLGIVAATLLFRASAPDQRGGLLRASVRTGLRIAGAIVLFVVIVNAWGFWRPDDDDEADSPAVATSSITGGRDESAGTAPAENADNADAADEAGTETPPQPASPEPIVRAYVAALERNDSVAVRAYHDSITEAFAGADLAKLNTRIEQLDERADSLEGVADEADRPRGVRTFIAGAADDVGVGFGWSAVYFTAFLALWRGQTPGKRAARVRVLRLDGKPLGWWISFERFGGYAASFSVGLLGFFQILWDRNRQGLHDKACETVVVKDSPQLRARS